MCAYAFVLWLFARSKCDLSAVNFAAGPFALSFSVILSLLFPPSWFSLCLSFFSIFIFLLLTRSRRRSSYAIVWKMLVYPFPMIQTSHEACSSGEFWCFIHLCERRKHALYCVLLSEESATRYCIIARDYLEGIGSYTFPTFLCTAYTKEGAHSVQTSNSNRCT